MLGKNLKGVIAEACYYKLNFDYTMFSEIDFSHEHSSYWREFSMEIDGELLNLEIEFNGSTE